VDPELTWIYVDERFDSTRVIDRILTRKWRKGEIFGGGNRQTPILLAGGDVTPGAGSGQGCLDELLEGVNPSDRCPGRLLVRLLARLLVRLLALLRWVWPRFHREFLLYELHQGI
jgi:hypothetical protein